MKSLKAENIQIRESNCSDFKAIDTKKPLKLTFNKILSPKKVW
jgi:hypothetical protein